MVRLIDVKGDSDAYIIFKELSIICYLRYITRAVIVIYYVSRYALRVTLYTMEKLSNEAAVLNFDATLL